MQFCLFLSWVLVGLALSEQPKGQLSATLQPFIDQQHTAGAVTLVANREKVLDVSVVGLADLQNQRLMAADSLFWIASMSKPITAAAFMMLVDEGKVSLDDPVEKYLPEFRGIKVQAESDDQHTVWVKTTHPITLRNVLSHTSGLGFKSAMEQPTLDALPLRLAVLSYAMGPLLFQPDTKYQYSNAGINTAARVIEVITGQSYEAFMDERLFRPLGMKDTTFWPSESQVSRVAKSYKPSADKSSLEEMEVEQLQYPLFDRAKRFPMPAGGLFSTASDVAVFCQMLLNQGAWKGKRYLSEHAIQALSSRQTGEGLASYGLGFSVGNDGSFGHGGAHSTNLTLYPKEGLITVFMIQNAGWRADEGKGMLPAFQKAAKSFFIPSRP
jgi:CubicO group peptidase (beta-lactamase class C family)